MLLYAWNQMAMLNRWPAEVEDAPNLDALLVSILAKLVQQRLRIGLGRNYIDEERLLRGLRGRVDFSESLKRLALQNGQAYCRFQEFSLNAPKNQIVRSTLTRVGQVGQVAGDPATRELRQTVRRLSRDLEGVDLVELSLAFIHRQNLGRNDNDYRLMLAICDLLLARQMPTEAASYRSLPGMNRDAMTLHAVYEKFVANFYRLHLSGWSVSAQSHLDWNGPNTSAYLPIMQPDVVLQHRASGRLIVLDTKYTANILSSGQYGQLKFDSSHIYQVYTYLRSQEHLSEQHRHAAGVLLYPAVEWPLSEEVNIDGHSIGFETVDLALAWKDIQSKLLAIANQRLTT